VSRSREVLWLDSAPLARPLPSGGAQETLAAGGAARGGRRTAGRPGNAVVHCAKHPGRHGRGAVGRLLAGMARSEPGGGQGRREWGRSRPWRLGAAGDRAAPVSGLPRVTGWRRCGRAGGGAGMSARRQVQVSEEGAHEVPDPGWWRRCAARSRSRVGRGTARFRQSSKL